MLCSVPPGDDWVSLWKRKCPVESLFDGSPKGRSLRAMRDRVEKLVASEDTDTANRLKSYLKVCTMAEQLRPDKLHRVPPAELSTLVSAMVAESVKLPVAVCTAIMEHRIATMLKGGSARRSCWRPQNLGRVPKLSSTLRIRPLAACKSTSV